MKNIELFTHVGHGINLGETQKPIHFTTEAKPLEHCQSQIWEYEFLDDENANGCFFIFPPSSKINAGWIIDPETTVNLEVTYGSGKCVICKQVSTKPFVSVVELKPETKLTIHHDEAYRIMTYDTGMVINSKTTPPYRPHITEQTLKPDDPSVTTPFWYWGECPPGP